MEKEMKVCIIGGGPLSLSTAYYLSKNKNSKITIYNSSKSLGGLASSFSLTNKSKIEKYYHHIFKSDKEFLLLAKELGYEKKIIFKSASTGHYLDNKLYDMSNILKLYSSNLLNLSGLIRLILGYIYVKFIWKNVRSLGAIDGSLKYFGKEVSNKIWGPLLRGKFSNYVDLVPFSWLAARIKDRTVDLGYFEGGFHGFYELLEKRLIQNGVNIINCSEVKAIKKIPEGFLVNEEKFNFVLSSVGPNKDALIDGISYKRDHKQLGAICAIFELNENPNIPYWTNYGMNDSPVLAIINHRELDKSSRFGNIYPVYVAAYLDPEQTLYDSSKEKLEDIFSVALSKVMKSNSHELNEITNAVHLFKSKYAQPLINPFLNLDPIEIYDERLICISMHSIYPNDRGQNYAFKYGKKAANYINDYINKK